MGGGLTISDQTVHHSDGLLRPVMAASCKSLNVLILTACDVLSACCFPCLLFSLIEFSYPRPSHELPVVLNPVTW